MLCQGPQKRTTMMLRLSAWVLYLISQVLGWVLKQKLTLTRGLRNHKYFSSIEDNDFDTLVTETVIAQIKIKGQRN